MSFDVIATNPFERKLKRLAKKYKSLATDLNLVVDELIENPTLGTPIGKKLLQIAYCNYFKRQWQKWRC